MGGSMVSPLSRYQCGQRIGAEASLIQKGFFLLKYDFYKKNASFVLQNHVPQISREKKSNWSRVKIEGPEISLYNSEAN